MKPGSKITPPPSLAGINSTSNPRDASPTTVGAAATKDDDKSIDKSLKDPLPAKLASQSTPGATKDAVFHQEPADALPRDNFSKSKGSNEGVMSLKSVLNPPSNKPIKLSSTNEDEEVGKKALITSGLNPSITDSPNASGSAQSKLLPHPTTQPTPSTAQSEHTINEGPTPVAVQVNQHKIDATQASGNMATHSSAKSDANSTTLPLPTNNPTVGNSVTQTGTTAREGSICRFVTPPKPRSVQVSTNNSSLVSRLCRRSLVSQFYSNNIFQLLGNTWPYRNFLTRWH